MKIVSYIRFALWTRLFKRWLSQKFESIFIDLTPVEEKLDDVKGDVADVKTAVENINVESADHLAQFFGLPESLPQYEIMSDTEITNIVQGAYEAIYGFIVVPNTLHTVNALGQQVEIATYFRTSRTYGDYGFPELWAQDDQQQWVSVLNDHPTADRDIYTYNPSNNE